MQVAEEKGCVDSWYKDCEVEKSATAMGHGFAWAVAGMAFGAVVGGVFSGGALTVIYGAAAVGFFMGGTGGVAYGAESGTEGGGCGTSFGEGENAIVRIDPLILDLNGDGIKLDNITHFDLDANGFAELTNWVDYNDGILAIDLNNDEIINDGTELFGDRTLLSNGNYATNGFQALADLDSNLDGKIDANDTKFSELHVIKGDSTVYTLNELGITSLNLSYSNTNTTDELGNTQVHLGNYQKSDGSTGQMGDYLLNRNVYYTVSTEDIIISDEINQLPEIQSIGSVYSLRQAMTKDTTNTLKNLVESFIAENNIANRSNLLDQILFKWTNSENIDPSSRGAFDARKLSVLESFLAKDFRNDSNSIVNTEAVGFLESSYNELKENMNSLLMIQSHLKNLYNLSVTCDEINNIATISLYNVATEIQNQIAIDEVAGKELLSEFNRTLKGGYLNNYSEYDSFYNTFAAMGAEYKWILDTANKTIIHGTENADNFDGTGANEAYFGYGGDDYIHGRQGDDLLEGGDGNDTLIGCDGNDILRGDAGHDLLDGINGNDTITGGTGNDTLWGGADNDTYMFNLGDGQDVIEDVNGTSDAGIDTIKFGEDITLEDLSFRGENTDLIITINGTTDGITVTDQLNDSNKKIENITFADGTSTTYTDILERLESHGTANNDTITGSIIAEKIYGYAGDDSIQTLSGNDTITGGAGNDSIEDSSGNELYIFNLGDGQDTISDLEGLDSIQFSDSITADDLIIQSVNNDLIISIVNTTDSITILGHLNSATTQRIERLTFTDGTFVEKPENLILGTTGDDSLTGNSSNNFYLTRSGNDTISDLSGGDDSYLTGTGNDVIADDSGNEIYYFAKGDGQDTITDNSGVDKIVFAENMNMTDLNFTRVVDNLVISVAGTTDTITIENWFTSDNNKIESFEFASGITVLKEDIENIDNLICGTIGDDSINGTTSNSLYVLSVGNDTINESGGNDTYFYSRGYGDDIIQDASGIDKIKFVNGINQDDVEFYRVYEDLVISLKDNSGKITISNGYLIEQNKIEQVQFSDDSILTSQDIKDLLDIYGTENDDSITGTTSNDVIYGYAGADTINAADGKDYIEGGIGNDSINAGYSDDIIYGEDGYDVINADSGNDVLYGGNDNDTLNGGTGNDTIYGDSGNDNISGGEGNDTIYGGEGDDSINGNEGSNFLDGGLGNDNIITNNYYIGNDTLIGGIGNDTLEGGGGDDLYLFNLGDGQDLIDDGSGGGNDTIRFGEGITQNDLLFSAETVGSSTNLVIRNKNNTDKITVNGHYWDNLWKVERLEFNDESYLTHTEIESLLGSYGTEGNDNLNGSFKAEKMYGYAGNDNISGLAGDDSIYGGDGDDTIYGNEGSNLLDGGSGNDTIRGEDYIAGNDTIIGGTGNDTLEGGAGDDLYLFNLGDGQDLIDDGPGGGNDIIRFGEGITQNDLLFSAETVGSNTNLVIRNKNNTDKITVNGHYYNDLWKVERFEFDDESYLTHTEVESLLATHGTENNDNINASNQSEEIYGYGGDDNISGLAGDDSIYGGDGNDIIYGKEGNNLLDGGSGNDTIRGEDYIVGNDTIIGGIGNDTLQAGAGDDVYIFNLGDGQDTIIDGPGGGNDIIRFGEGITQDDLLFSAVNAGDNDNLIIKNKNNSDQISILGHYYSSPNWTIERFEFDDETYLTHTEIESLLATHGTETNDNINGSNQSEEIYGYGGDDNISGLAGDDSIYGGDGNDIIYGKEGNNLLDGGSGNDTIRGEDYIVGNDTIIGGIGNDTLQAGAGDDVYIFNLGDGQDTIIDGPGGGNDIIRFGAGISQSDLTFSATTVNNITHLIVKNKNNSDQITIAGHYWGPEWKVEKFEFADGTSILADNLLTGTINNDTLIGNTLNNYIYGNEGNDILDGGLGNDTLIGGIGNDTYIVDTTTDTIIENLNEGTDTVQSSVSYTLGNNLENLTLTGINSINGTGNELSNTITGNSSDNILTGMDGNDILDGGTGIDTLIGGLGNDIYIVDSTTDVITENISEGIDTVESSVSYTLGSNLENLALTGIDSINATGNELDNTITGNTGNNILDGGIGIDTLIGGLGNDTYIVDSTTDVITENISEGIDTVESSVSYTLGSNLENLTLTGTDSINGTGNDLDNTITGNSANNVLNGGTGADTLAGGAGNDTYYVDNAGDVVTENSSEGTDTVNSSATYTLGSNVENLILTGTDSINATGNELDNTITGNTGNNILDGGIGIDTLIGGLGNDTYIVDSTTDVITENISEGIDTVESSVSYTLGSNLENLTLTGTDSINGTGNDLDNTITGNSANNVLNGGTGADILVGGAGNDTYIVDTDTDVIVENGDSTNTDLLFHFDGANESTSITEEVLGLTSTAYGDAALSTNVQKFGDTSLGSQGSGYVSVANNEAFNINQNGGGFDFWLYLENNTSGSTYGEWYIIGNSQSAGDGNWYLGVSPNNEIFLTKTGASNIGYGAGQSIISLNNWYHIEVNKTDLCRIFINGVKVLEGTNQFNDNLNNLFIFDNPTGTQFNGMQAYIDELRFFDVTQAHTQNYTVPNAPYSINEGIDTVESSVSYTLGSNVENLTLTGTNSINGTGNDLDNTITGNSATNVLNGGTGADTYIFGSGDGIDIINDSAGTDEINFESDVTRSNIALYYDSSTGDLIVDYGTTAGNDKVSFTDYNHNTDNNLERIETNEGDYLTVTQINNIISEITSYNANNDPDLTSVEDVKGNSTLMTYISSQWQT